MDSKWRELPSAHLEIYVWLLLPGLICTEHTIPAIFWLFEAIEVHNPDQPAYRLCSEWEEIWKAVSKQTIPPFSEGMTSKAYRGADTVISGQVQERRGSQTFGKKVVVSQEVTQVFEEKVIPN